MLHFGNILLSFKTVVTSPNLQVLIYISFYIVYYICILYICILYLCILVERDYSMDRRRFDVWYR